jgi:hypothetical protein
MPRLLHVGMLWTELGRRRHAGLVGRLRDRERELAAVEVLLERRGWKGLRPAHLL